MISTLANNSCHLSHTSDSRASGQFKFGVTGATFRILHLAVDDNTMDNDDSDLWLMPHSILGYLCETTFAEGILAVCDRWGAINVTMC